MILGFLKVVGLSEPQKMELKQKLETWWLQVSYQQPLDVALAVASLADKSLDLYFGKNLFWSRRVWFRSFIISSGLLLVMLSMTAIGGKESFWVTPWKNYKDSIDIVATNVDALFSTNNLEQFRQGDITNTIPAYKRSNFIVLHYETNYYLTEISTNTVKDIKHITPFGHGTLYFSYFRFTTSVTNQLASTNSTVTQSDIEKSWRELAKGADSLKQYALKHSSNRNVAVYSLTYFTALFLLNSFLFVTSLAASRLTLEHFLFR